MLADGLLTTSIAVPSKAYVEELKQDVSWYQEQGKNPFSNYINIFLVIGVFLGGISTVFAGAAIWGSKKQYKSIASFIIAILIVAVSAASLYIKSENDRFYENNRNQYTKLAQELGSIISNFYLQFARGGYNDSNIEEYRQEFLDITKNVIDESSQIKLKYFEAYGLEINPTFDGER